ncbi:unnamed protein product [Toxocara canis]|uniref:WH2 domain-containing protein n=1 Tax=Toxocara canis TaxID=6265 RepID=A0A183V6U6_TOXCA|nr:unnamed protein product [Toxocara canis]
MTPTDESGKPSISPNAKRRRNEPLKMVNARARIAPPPAAPRPPPKPRQSLLPPKIPVSKPGKDIESSKKHESAKRTEGASTVIAQRSTPANASLTKSKHSDSFKLKRLNAAVRAFDAVSTVLKYALQKVSPIILLKSCYLLNRELSLQALLILFD